MAAADAIYQTKLADRGRWCQSNLDRMATALKKVPPLPRGALRVRDPPTDNRPTRNLPHGRITRRTAEAWSDNTAGRLQRAAVNGVEASPPLLHAKRAM